MINNKKKNNKKKMSKKTGKPTAARRIRTKTRKPRFLSLISLELMSSEKAQETTETPPTDDDDVSKGQLQYLFPLHPENLVEENYYCNNNNNNKDSLHDENMEYLFSAAADGGGAASTLTGLLGSSAATTTTTTTTTSSSYNSGEEDDYYYKSQLALVRTALKNKERDSSEERYVRYSEVVERRRDEEVSSTAGAGADDVDDLRCGSNRINGNQKRLSLKLDYEEILNAWSDKGPLYVYAESPRTVPDIIHHQFLPHEFPIITNGAASDNGWRNHECSWRVPELTRNIAKVHHGIKEQKQHQQEQEPVVVVGEEEWKVGQREASVLRYKEKRQNRLFAKRIRYQVRKLNAEKRPRVKGRFVKRS